MLQNQPGSTNDKTVMAALSPPHLFKEPADYNLCYFPLFDLFRRNQLDFPALAAQMNVRQRRLKEIIQFRMGSPDVRQLFGHEAGSCYLCSKRVPVDKETVCYTCLRQFYRFAFKEDDSGSVPTHYGFTKRQLQQ